MPELTIHRVRSLMDLRDRQTVTEPWRGQTAGEVLEQHAAGDAMVVWRDGAPVDELDTPLAPGAVVLLPRVAEPTTIFLVASIVLTVVSAVSSYLVARKIGAQAGGQERGDEASPTYSFAGVQSEYRQGYVIGVVLGEHDVGPQVIYTEVANGATELLRVVLVVSDGRIDSIGGVQGNSAGEADFLGSLSGSPSNLLPADIRVNGNRLDSQSTILSPGAEAFIRLGEVTQTPLPDSVFNGARTTLQVNGDLNEAGDSFLATIQATVPVVRIDVVLRFPAGLYSQGQTGALSNYLVDFATEWREVGTTTWGGGPIVSVGGPGSQSIAPLTFFRTVFTVLPAAALNGPIEVRLRRRTPSGGSQVVSRCEWDQLIFASPFTFSYPRCALLGLNLQASEQISGGRPNFVVRARGLKCRVWDPVQGLSTDRYWDVPPSGDPFRNALGYAYPIGNNPAWLLAEWLTSEVGLGEWLADDDIDWQAIRDWADFCDQNVPVDGVNEAAFRCDLVIDNPTRAMDVVSQICATGRAVPVFDGDRISVRDQFRDGTTRGNNAVAAKQRSHIVTTSNVRDFRVEFLNPEDRAGTIFVEIRNQAKDYARDPIPVEDPNAGFNNPAALTPLRFTKRTEQLIGVTRESQAIREGLFLHSGARLIRSRVSFRIGPEALRADVGDLIGVQHDALRPYDTEGLAYRLASGANGFAIELDHSVTLQAGRTYVVVLRETSGAVTEATITTGEGTYAAGTPLTIDVSVVALKSAPVALGERVGGSQEAVKDYEVVSVGIADEQTLEVEALEWVPEIHDVIDVGQTTGGSFLTSGGTGPFGSGETPPPVTGITVAGAAAPGVTIIGWDAPAGFVGSSARVYARPQGGDSWFLVGETRGTSLETAMLTVGDPYEVAVGVASRQGAYPPPGTYAVEATPPEFPALPVAPISGLSVESHETGVLLRWRPTEAQDLDYYEIRTGPWWTGGQVLARTPEATYFVENPPPGQGFLVRARMRHGLYSIRHADLADPAWTPATDQLLAASLVGTGTLNQVDYSAESGELRLSAGATAGQWTSAVQDLGYSVRALWRFGFYTRTEDSLTIGEDTGTCGDGEARWAASGARDASPANPGTDLVGVAQSESSSALVQQATVAGYRAEPGEYTLALLEVSFDGGAFERFRPQRRAAQTAQFRLTLRRQNQTHQVYAGGQSLEVHF